MGERKKGREPDKDTAGESLLRCNPRVLAQGVCTLILFRDAHSYARHERRNISMIQSNFRARLSEQLKLPGT